MNPFPLRLSSELKRYEKHCEKYDEVIEMFKELGSGSLDRRDVLNNIKSMVENGLIEKLETTIEQIELYEEWHY